MRKYLPYIVGYSIYASIILVILLNGFRGDIWPYMIGWLITAPLILWSIFYLIKKHYRKEEDTSVQISTVDQEEDSLFTESMSLTEFIVMYGPKMQVGMLTNKTTGEPFKVCSFINTNGERTLVYFFSQLGELSPEEISKRKEELKVGKINSKYYLYCEAEAWENVDL